VRGAPKEPDAATGKKFGASQPIAYEMHEAARGHGKGPKSTPVLVTVSFTPSAFPASFQPMTYTGKLKWRRNSRRIIQNFAAVWRRDVTAGR
jgi:hypothetical protein